MATRATSAHSGRRRDKRGATLSFTAAAVSGERGEVRPSFRREKDGERAEEGAEEREEDAATSAATSDTMLSHRARTTGSEHHREHGRDVCVRGQEDEEEEERRAEAVASSGRRSRRRRLTDTLSGETPAWENTLERGPHKHGNIHRAHTGTHTEHA